MFINFKVAVIEHRINEDLLLNRWTTFQLDIMRQRSCYASISAITLYSYIQCQLPDEILLADVHSVTLQDANLP